MLEACVLDFQGSWNKYLSLVEFAYNNSYHSIIDLSPYDALYEQAFIKPNTELLTNGSACLHLEPNKNKNTVKYKVNKNKKNGHFRLSTR